MTADRPTTEPRTEAGRDVLASLIEQEPEQADMWRRAILAIEAEARSTPAEALPEAPQGPCTTECCDLQDVRHIHPAHNREADHE